VTAATIAPTPAYTGPVFVRGDVVKHTTPLGETTIRRVRRVVLLKAHDRPSVVVMRYLELEGFGLLVPSTDCVAGGAR